MNTKHRQHLRTARLVVLPIIAAAMSLSAFAHPQSAQNSGSHWKTVTPYSGTSNVTGPTIIAGERTEVISGSGDSAVSGQRVTVVTTTDNDHTIELKIDNGKMTVKCDGKEIPESRIQKSDDGVTILDEQGNEIDVIKVRLDDHGAAVFDGMNGAWSFGDPGSFAWTQAQPFGMLQSANPPKVMLGISMSEPGPALEKHLGIKAAESVMISGLYRGLPADKAGLEQYDIIVKINGDSPADRESIQKALADHDDDDTITLSVIHAGKPREVKVHLQKYDGEAMEKAEFIGDAGDNVQTMYRKMFEGDKFPQMWRGTLVAPNSQIPDVYVAPYSAEIQQKIQDQMGRMGRHGADLNGRLDDMNKRMADLEKLLEKLVDKAEHAR